MRSQTLTWNATPAVEAPHSATIQLKLPHVTATGRLALRLCELTLLFTNMSYFKLIVSVVFA